MQGRVLIGSLVPTPSSSLFSVEFFFLPFLSHHLISSSSTSPPLPLPLALSLYYNTIMSVTAPTTAAPVSAQKTNYVKKPSQEEKDQTLKEIEANMEKIRPRLVSILTSHHT